MKKFQFSISWIYGEFRIARMQKGFTLERWTAPFTVHNLQSLNQALLGASAHMDLSRGGDLTIIYEDDLHTHSFFDVPNMAKKDLEKSLLRKVEQNKPFEEKAAWCYHEAKHNEEEEGILLHIMPQHIVDAIVRLCQEFYLTPRQLVPLTEVVSSVTQTYKVDEKDILVIVALFNERTEILVTVGDGEVLFVRELPYSGFEEDPQRLITDINRTIRYAKQKYRKTVNDIWLIGENTEQILELIDPQIEGKLHFDSNGLDPFYWVGEVAKLKGQLSANFIPLLAQKQINRTLFYRAALVVLPFIALAAVATVTTVEYALAKQSAETEHISVEIDELTNEINRIENLIFRGEQSKQKLQLLQGSAHNLPALFVNHLGDIVPAGITLTSVRIRNIANEWQIEMQGKSDFDLNQTAEVLLEFETKLTQSPWNISITKSWKSSWYGQLRAGAAASNGQLAFEMEGWMK
ncbi:MAG: hypothetical protein L3J46_01605 [Kangiellaceae bacterium]|nr:hypothetical protein [Kangiellaceae bacterium]